MPKLKADPLSKRSCDCMDRSYYRSIGEKTPVFRYFARRQKKLAKKLESVGHTYRPKGRMEARWKRQFLECFEEPPYAVGYY
jgi:hypothetical protein